MRCDWRTASRAVGDGAATTSGATTPSLAFVFLGVMGAAQSVRARARARVGHRCRPRVAGVEVLAQRRDGSGDGSKRLPREDREIFQVPVNLRGFMRFGEQETLTDPDLF